MDDYPTYQTYKDSGIAWLGEIPAHWEVIALKRHLLPRAGAIKTGPFGSQLLSSEMNESDVKVYNQRNVLDRNFKSGENYISEEKFKSLKAFEVFSGDFLVTTRGTIGRCAILPDDYERGILHPCLMRLQLDQSALDNNFFAHMLQNGRVIFEQLQLKSNATTIDVIYSETLKSVFLPTPPLPEQQAIARFLDDKTAQIDALIAKKEALLAKLAEKRTALISQAVTKGLDPTVPMKDSGIAWLGEIPTHWKLLPLKFAITFQRGHDLPTDKRVEGDIPLVSSSGISAQHDEAKAKGPGIVTGRYGTIGKFTYLEEDYWPLNTTLYSIRTYDNNTRFLYYMMHNLSDLFLLNSQKSAVPGVDRNDLHPVLTALPPKIEQDQIVEAITKRTQEIDAQTCKIVRVIEVLQEYRSALITNAVTGKIDVRAVTVPAPSPQGGSPCTGKPTLKPS